jgi:DNA repair protein RadC
MAKRKANSIAETGMWNAYEYSVKRVARTNKSAIITTPRELAALFREFADAEMSEALFVVSFGGRNNLLGIHRVYTGTATGTSVRIGELMRSALMMGAVGLALVHNHPSGDSEASNEDIGLTSEVAKAASLLDLSFIDHLVVGANGAFTSIRSQKPNIFDAEDSRLAVIGGSN